MQQDICWPGLEEIQKINEEGGLGAQTPALEIDAATSRVT